MSVRKLTANLLAALGLLAGLTSVAHAQRPPVHVPIAQDPFAFDPDFRWFEPIYDMDLLDMKPSQRFNTGWFATYDRTAMYASRPELEDPNAAETKLDDGRGHRYEIGFMLPHEETGWFFTYSELGVGGFFTVTRERLNRFNEDQLTGDNDPAQPPFGFPVPASDGNTPGLNTRTYFIQDTENVVDYSSYEINRSWRLDAFHYGGVIEPMIGMRYMQIQDLNARQVYTSTLDVDLFPPDFPPLEEFGDDVEQLISDKTVTDNDMFFGQLGFRYSKWYQRFLFSSDFRFFFGGSWQCSKSNRLSQITIYDGAGAAEVDNYIVRQTTPIYTNNEEFSIGFDVRGELAYQCTRDISVRVGAQLVDVATGVWRGGSRDPSRNQLLGGPENQDLIMLGGTLGLTLNR